MSAQDFDPEKVRNLRLAMGFGAPADFASAINAQLKKDPTWNGPTEMSWRTIDRLEKGQHDPSISTIRAISRAFGLRWEVFLVDLD